MLSRRCWCLSDFFLRILVRNYSRGFRFILVSGFLDRMVRYAGDLTILPRLRLWLRRSWLLDVGHAFSLPCDKVQGSFHQTLLSSNSEGYRHVEWARIGVVTAVSRVHVQLAVHE